MSEKIEIVQKSAPASHTTQIGVQYTGMSPDQAAKQTVDLFMDNFPKLQALAREIVEQRVAEFCDEIRKEIENKQVTDLTPFSEPDLQYVLYEAQKNYVRFGGKDKLRVLTTLIVNRVKNNSSYLERVLDNAIIIAGELSSAQLDFLSILFVLTRVKITNIKTIEDLEELFNYIPTVFCLDQIKHKREISFLSFKGCVNIQLPNIPEILSKTYELDVNEIKKIIPKTLEQFSTDYGISDVGIVLAIVNAKHKSRYSFNLRIWIPD